MQKHKKWLVITIWISTIAFVGAGFVGWGSYDYGKSSGAVAVVGDRKVTYDEYQREYSNLYQQYSQIFGEKFNQEMAKQMKLSELAYQFVIEKNLIMSFGDELGLDVTAKDVAKELVQMPAFIKDGKFDKETYLKVLSQNGTNAQDFENTIKRNLLLQKVEQLFKVNTQASEVKNLNQLLFSEDKIAIKILKADNITVNVDNSKLKEYWEKNKLNYMSAPSYELQFSKAPIVSVEHATDTMKNHYGKFKNDFKKEDGKLKSFEEAKSDIVAALNKKAAKKEALKKYIKLKKGEANFDSSAVLYEDKLNYSADNITKIKGAVPGTVIKPFVEGNDYVTIKVVNTFKPKPLAFEKVKNDVIVDYSQVLKTEELQVQVVEELDNFKGQEIGFVNRHDIAKIPGLNPTQASEFLNKLFATTAKKGDITIGNDVVLYEILDSRLGTYDAAKDSAVQQTLKQLQDAELMTNLVKRLELKYEVHSLEPLRNFIPKL